MLHLHLEHPDYLIGYHNKTTKSYQTEPHRIHDMRHIVGPPSPENQSSDLRHEAKGSMTRPDWTGCIQYQAPRHILDYLIIGFPHKTKRDYRIEQARHHSITYHMPRLHPDYPTAGYHKEKNGYQNRLNQEKGQWWCLALRLRVNTT